MTTSRGGRAEPCDTASIAFMLSARSSGSPSVSTVDAERRQLAGAGREFLGAEDVGRLVGQVARQQRAVDRGARGRR